MAVFSCLIPGCWSVIWFILVILLFFIGVLSFYLSPILGIILGIIFILWIYRFCPFLLHVVLWVDLVALIGCDYLFGGFRGFLLICRFLIGGELFLMVKAYCWLNFMVIEGWFGGFCCIDCIFSSVSSSALKSD